jgi:hypothetical protein
LRLYSGRLVRSQRKRLRDRAKCLFVVSNNDYTLAGILAFFRLPVSALPQVDFPTISVQAQLPGASPETVATSVASPLERHLGKIANVTEMTSQSGFGQTRTPCNSRWIATSTGPRATFRGPLMRRVRTCRPV